MFLFFKNDFCIKNFTKWIGFLVYPFQRSVGHVLLLEVLQFGGVENLEVIFTRAKSKVCRKEIALGVCHLDDFLASGAKIGGHSRGTYVYVCP